MMAQTPTMTPGAPTGDQRNTFDTWVSAGLYQPAADYARNLGYSDNQISQYVTDNNLKSGYGDQITGSSEWLASHPTAANTNYAAQQGGGGGGGGAPSLTAYTKNPYLDEMAQGITSQMNDNWSRNIAPGLRSGAMATGGFGGSRQGVVEANGANDMNRSLSQNLANLYGSDFNNSQNRNLQQYSADQGYNLGMTNANNNYSLGLTNASNNYNLGMANNNLGFANLDSNNAQFGANLNLNTMNAQNAWATNGTNAANGISQQPINYFNTFSGNANTSGGMGNNSTSTTGSTTNGLTTGLGTGMAVDLLGNYIKTPASPSFGSSGNSSFGEGQY